MYLSNRDLLKAIKCGQLIVDPLPDEKHFGPNAIDLQLDSVDAARIWDCVAYETQRRASGDQPRELRIGKFDYRQFSPKFLIAPPSENRMLDQKVFQRGNEIIVKPGGFVLWQTKETIGTPQRNSKYICFVDGKSTRARTGLLVHLTAPTIHARWKGNITLEIANLGPFDFVLQEGDVIAQITVAQISSPPIVLKNAHANINTDGQRSVLGRTGDATLSKPQPAKKPSPPKNRKK